MGEKSEGTFTLLQGGGYGLHGGLYNGRASFEQVCYCNVALLGRLDDEN